MSQDHSGDQPQDNRDSMRAPGNTDKPESEAPAASNTTPAEEREAGPTPQAVPVDEQEPTRRLDDQPAPAISSPPPAGPGQNRWQQAYAAVAQNIGALGSGTAVFITMLLLLNTFIGSGRYNTLSPVVLADGRSGTRQGVPLVTPVPIAPAAGDDLELAVKRANDAFSAARRQASTTPLQGIAVEAWLASELQYTSGLRARNQFEQWKLKELTFLQKENKGNTAFVCTREVWEVTTLDSNGRALSTSTYTFTEGYYLNRANNTWVINRVEVG